jgi:cytochrome c556
MRPNTSAVLIFAPVFGTAAVARTDVKNPALKARMESMKQIVADMKVIGEMVKGNTPVDVSAARTAAASIARLAAEKPAPFEANEDDPKSEAPPSIWTNFEDFTAKSADLQKVAQKLSPSMTDASDLVSALETLGGTCRACHKLYRE